MRDYQNLVRDSVDVLYKTSNLSNEIQAQEDINGEVAVRELELRIHNIRQLQIRMPIIAPRKAGKSTIINATLGGEYLPTRSDAMTALPTSITLKLGKERSEEGATVKFTLETTTKDALEVLESAVIKILKENFQNND